MSRVPTPAAPEPALRPRRGVLFVVGLGILLGFAVQGMRGLYRPDEGRYSAVALRMLDDGNWIDPELNPETPHYAKPPLTYWCLAVSFSVFGRNPFAARLPNALAFLATLLLLAFAARRFAPTRPWLPVALYSVCAVPRIASYVVTTDTLLALFTTLAVCGFIAWRFDEARPSAMRVLMWLGLSLGFLTKGPPALVPLLGIIVFTIWQDGWRKVGALWSWIGAGLFLVVGLGWYIAVVVSHAGLASYFIHDEVLARMFSSAHRRNPGSLFVFAVYVPLLLVGCFPWLRPVWRGLVGAARAWGNSEAGPQRFLLCWVATGFTVFALVGSRLPLYLLPLFPALILMATIEAPASLLRTRWSAWLLAAVTLFGVLGTMASHWLPVKDDSLALAHSVEAQVPFVPCEVFFFRKPHYALALYLGCTVEKIALEAGTDADGHLLEGLGEELGEPDRRQLYCVDPHLDADFRATIARLDVPLRVVGRTPAYRFYARVWRSPSRPGRSSPSLGRWSGPRPTPSGP